MKNKLTTAAIILCLSFSSAAVHANSLDKDALQAKVAGMSEEQKDARALEIRDRVEAIKTMDKSYLTREERKELRRELKDMKKEAKSIGRGGVYISLGGILLIILLLIILL